MKKRTGLIIMATVVLVILACGCAYASSFNPELQENNGTGNMTYLVQDIPVMKLPDSSSGTLTGTAAGTPPAGTPPGGTGSGIVPAGTPPTGTPPGGSTDGSVPGGSQGTSSATFSGVYTLDSTSATLTGANYRSDTTDVSAVYVTDGGNLTLINPVIVTTGDTSSNDASSFYGLNAAVLANNGGTVKISGGTITTSGTGANGAFPSGKGSSITLSDVTIQATGKGGHGVMTSSGGSLSLTDVDIETTGANGAPLATDRGGGTVVVNGGTVTASGTDSPGIYSTGDITVTGADIRATNAEAVVTEGANSVTLTDTSISGAKGSKDNGIMLYQSMSGDAETGTSSLVMNGGTYTWPSTTGPAFYVTNTKAVISLKGTEVESSSGTLLKATAGNWGTSGSNGGTVTFTADAETLSGSIVSDDISSIAVTFKNGSRYMGAINSAAVSLDASSQWVVTGDSVLTSLTDSGGISGTSITNIIGNGYTVYYDTGSGSGAGLSGKTYSLQNGGVLRPLEGVTPVSTTVTPAGTPGTPVAPVPSQAPVVNGSAVHPGSSISPFIPGAPGIPSAANGTKIRVRVTRTFRPAQAAGVSSGISSCAKGKTGIITSAYDKLASRVLGTG